MAKNKFHSGPGPSQRQLRVGELIRRTLSDLLMRGEIHDPELTQLSITVGEVRTTPDQKVAPAYVMPLGGGHAEEALAALRRNSAEIRHQLARQTELKYAPRVRFELDETFDKMDETRRLFAQEDVRRDLDSGDEDGDDAG